MTTGVIPLSDQTSQINIQAKRGLADSGHYFRYMAEFIGLTAADILAVRQTKPIIEKSLSKIVGEFYEHLLSYPPTRKFFLKRDGSLDIEYIELRMRHLSNFWIRTSDAVFDDDYARYVDYVGRAHTSHGADPHIYIAERYVIGQVGFMQRAIKQVIVDELHGRDDQLEHRATAAWDKLMMVLLEMLSRAYSTEREEETFDPLVPVDQVMVARLATHAYEHEFCQVDLTRTKNILIGKAAEIPDGDRKIVKVDSVSIGVFHHKGQWYALRNSCLHRGGPIATGDLSGDTLVCPWHGYQYDLKNGELIADPSAKLAMYPVVEQNGEVYLMLPDEDEEGHHHDFSSSMEGESIKGLSERGEQSHKLAENEFWLADVTPGNMKQLFVQGETIAVYNVDGRYFATQSLCTHTGGELTEGDLEGIVVRCPVHSSEFRIDDGMVIRGPARKTLKTYRVTSDEAIGRIEEHAEGV